MTDDAGALTEARGDSVAVLNCKSLSPAAEDAYFAEGMADEVRGVLTRIPDIRTVAATISDTDPGTDMRSLGERLGVDYLLEGSVRKAGSAVRLVVRMIRTSDASLVWSETYQRTIDDVFLIQDAIAETVAIQLRSTLYLESIRARARSRTDSAQAYDHYLTALFYKSRSWELVAEYAKRAIDADPDFGLARALLARAYLTRLGGQIPAAQAYPAARAEVDRALILDPDDPDTLLMLGHLERAAGNYQQAESVYRSVKARAPNLVSTGLANLLQLVGRLEEALDEYDYSTRLDPSAGTTFHGMALVSVGRISDAAAWIEQLDVLSPNKDTKIFWRCFRVMMYAHTGDHHLIEPLWELQRELNPEAYASFGYLIYALGMTGRKDDAERLFGELESRTKRGYVSPVALVFGAMGLEDHDRFFFWLDRAIDEQVLMVTSLLSASPLMDPFRDDPRYDAALDRLNLLQDVVPNPHSS